MKGKRLLGIGLFTAAVLLMSGCETAYLTDSAIDAASVGRNEVKVAVGNNVKVVNHAVEEVCEDLDLDRLSRNNDLLISHYEFRTPQDEHITIFTRATSAISTEVRIQFDHNSDPSNPNNIMGRLREYTVYGVAFVDSDDTPAVAVVN